MLADNVPSLELLNAGIKNKVGEQTETFVKELRDLLPKNNMQDIRKCVLAWMASVKKSTGLKISFRVENTSMWVGASVTSRTSYPGHGGSQFNAKEMRLGDSILDNTAVSVDREKGFVSGPMAEAVDFMIMITGFTLRKDSGMTDSEITSLLLHEMGHAFTFFESLGDYVYLNAYLTEGIEILQGRKSAKIGTVILSQSWIDTNIPKEQLDNFANERTDTNARRVLLHGVKLPSRGHLGDNGFSSKKRDEQMADMFPTRLGYGRALATALAKLDMASPNSLERGKSTWVAETVKGMLLFLAWPAVAYAIVSADPLDKTQTSTNYDNGLERLLKIRRDLIQQLKLFKGTGGAEGLVEDIDAIDTLTKAYGKDRGIYEELILFFRPSIRKMVQNTNTEEKLEALLNNDLFVNIFKLKNL